MAYQISDDCISCGVCASNCPVSAISEGDGKYVIDAIPASIAALARRIARLALRLRLNHLELADVFGLAGCVLFVLMGNCVKVVRACTALKFCGLWRKCKRVQPFFDA